MGSGKRRFARRWLDLGGIGPQQTNPWRVSSYALRFAPLRKWCGVAYKVAEYGFQSILQQSGYAIRDARNDVLP